MHVDSTPKTSRKWKIHSMYIQIEEKLLGGDWRDSFATEILDAKYEKADIGNANFGRSRFWVIFTAS